MAFLTNWYSPQVWDISLKMLGKRTRPEMKTKAAETVGLLKFAVTLLEKYGLFLGVDGAALLESGRAAMLFNDIVKSSGRCLDLPTRQRLLTAVLRHSNLFLRAGGVLTPKHHLMLHCVQRTGLKGNPRFYHTYRDESLNGRVARIARTSHRLTFCDTVHRKFRILSRLQPVLGMC